MTWYQFRIFTWIYITNIAQKIIRMNDCIINGVALGYCVGKLFVPILGIRDGPLIG